MTPARCPRFAALAERIRAELAKPRKPKAAKRRRIQQQRSSPAAWIERRRAYLTAAGRLDQLTQEEL